MRRLALLLLVTLITITTGCALSRHARIADVAHHPARYNDKTITVEGVVTNAWAVPLVPWKLYRVDDGTGQLTIVSQGPRTPTRGARVRVRGKVEEVAVFGGRSLGLHMREADLNVLHR